MPLKLAARPISVSVFTLGSSLTIVANFPDRLNKYTGFPDVVWDILLLTGLVLIIVSGILYVFEHTPPLRSVTYNAASVQKSALPRLYEFIRDVLDEVAPYEVFESWYEKNPHVIIAVVKNTQNRFTSRQDIVGFFSVFPVNELAADLLWNNQLIGSGFSAGHICSQKEKPAAYYIGAVGGKGSRGRSYTLQHLIGHMAALLRHGPKTVFTRPMTSDGMRIARNYRFTPVRHTTSEEKDKIHVRDFQNDPVRI